MTEDITMSFNQFNNGFDFNSPINNSLNSLLTTMDSRSQQSTNIVDHLNGSSPMQEGQLSNTLNTRLGQIDPRDQEAHEIRSFIQMNPIQF